MLADRRVAGMPLLVLGGGSNVLFTQDFDGCVLKVEIPGVQRDDDGARWLVQVGAGENWHALVERLIDDDVPGLENLALIPGSVGAAPIQNIGAYGVELAERFDSLQAWDFADQALQTLTADDCGFGYRDSAFKRRSATAIDRQRHSRAASAVDAGRRLHRCRKRAARSEHPAAAAARRLRCGGFDSAAQVAGPGSSGKRGQLFQESGDIRVQQRSALIERHPSLVSYDIGGGRYKLAAGWLIDACGLKGTVRGRAAVYEKQALVLVNLGGATGAEILALAREVQEAVLARFRIELEPEPRIL